MGMQRGFTIIEVILFLAISSMLFLIAFSYTSNTIRNTGFTDDKNQVTQFIERKYLNVKNSQSTRDDNTTARCDATDADTQIPGASNRCMVIGTLLYFPTGGPVAVSTIVGNVNLPAASASLTEREVVEQLNPRVLSNGSAVQVSEQFESPARLDLRSVKYKPTGAASAANVVAIIRSPISENVFQAAWSVTDGNLASTFNDASGGIASRFTATSPYVDRPIIICYQNSDSLNRYAAIQIPSGQALGRITSSVAAAGQVLPETGLSC